MLLLPTTKIDYLHSSGLYSEKVLEILLASKSLRKILKKNSREAGLKKKKNSRKLIKLIGTNYLSIFGSYCTMDYHILTNNLNIALQLKNSMWDMRVMMTSARRWRVTAKWMNLQWYEKNLSIQMDFFFGNYDELKI